MKILIVTGMSGAGKKTTMTMLEDLGYFCVDNLPLALIPKFAELADNPHSELNKVAIGIDIRTGLSEFDKAIEFIENYEILFLESGDEALIKRFKETRRSHPYAIDGRIEDGIKKERQELKQLKAKATYVIDTSQLLSRELKAQINDIFSHNKTFKNMYITVLSFGYKYGVPSDSDLVFDVRFLPNPYYIEELKPKTGNDKEVQDYVLSFEEADIFLDKLEDLIDFLVPNYIKEGKNQLVVAVGCTGGKHRSVTLANKLGERIKVSEKYSVKIEHRDILKDSLRGK